MEAMRDLCMYVCTLILAHVQARVFMCRCACMHACATMYVHMCMFIPVCIYACLCMNDCIFLYTHVLTCVIVYVCAWFRCLHVIMVILKLKEQLVLCGNSLCPSKFGLSTGGISKNRKMTRVLNIIQRKDNIKAQHNFSNNTEVSRKPETTA